MRTRPLTLSAFALLVAACSNTVGPEPTDGTLIVANASNGWIDVDIDGRRRFNGLSMGGLSYGLSVPKGLHVVRVSNGGVFPSAIEVPVEVDLEVPLTLIAYPTYPVGSSPGISAAMVADTGAWVPGGKSKLRVVHLAATTRDMQIWRRQPDAPAGSAIMTPLAYGAASQYVQSDAGVWEVWLTAPGGGAKLLSSGPIQIPSGDRRSVLLVDTQEGPRFVVMGL